VRKFRRDLSLVDWVGLQPIGATGARLGPVKNRFVHFRPVCTLSVRITLFRQLPVVRFQRFLDRWNPRTKHCRIH